MYQIFYLYSGGYVGICDCDFDLNFSDELLYRPSFHVLICQPYLLYYEVFKLFALFRLGCSFSYYWVLKFLYIFCIQVLYPGCIFLSFFFFLFFFLQMSWRVHKWKQKYYLKGKCSGQGKIPCVCLRKWLRRWDMNCFEGY